MQIIMRVFVFLIISVFVSMQGMKKTETFKSITKRFKPFSAIQNESIKSNTKKYFDVSNDTPIKYEKSGNLIHKKIVPNSQTQQKSHAQYTKIQSLRFDKGDSLKGKKGFANLFFDQKKREYSTQKSAHSSKKLERDPLLGKNISDLFTNLTETERKKQHRKLAKIYNTDNGTWPSLERMKELNGAMDSFSKKPLLTNNEESNYSHSPEQPLNYNPITMNKSAFKSAFIKAFNESGIDALDELYDRFIKILTNPFVTHETDFQYLSMEGAIKEVIETVVNPVYIQNLSKDIKGIYDELLLFKECQWPCYDPFKIVLHDGSIIFLPSAFIRSGRLTPYSRFEKFSAVASAASKIYYLQKDEFTLDQSIVNSFYKDLVFSIGLRLGMSKVLEYNEKYKTNINVSTGYFRAQSLQEIINILTKNLNEYEDIIQKGDFSINPSNEMCYTVNMNERDPYGQVRKDLFATLYYRYLLGYLMSSGEKMYDPKKFINFKLFIDTLKTDKDLLNKFAQDIFDFQQKDSLFKEMPARKKWFGIF